MFGNLGVHIIQFPSGKFGFVGTLPACLGELFKASTEDIMAGRAFAAPDGTPLTVKFPVFETAEAARSFALSRDVSPRVC